MDIMAALDAVPQPGTGRCQLMQFLDSIPEDTEGRDELIRLVETVHVPGGNNTRSARTMTTVLAQLGHPCTENPIHYHRARSCRCYR